MTSEGLLGCQGDCGTHLCTALWVSIQRKCRGFLLMTEHSGAGLVPGLEQWLAKVAVGGSDQAGGY